MEHWQQDRIGSARDGTNPMVMAKLPLAYAVLGDIQFLPGYAVLLVDRPGVDRLSDLSPSEQTTFLTSMAWLGQAVETACQRLDPGFRRVNLEILGNTDAFLHAHVWPRYAWEPADLVGRPVWLYPPQCWTDPDPTAIRSGELRAAITTELVLLGARAVDQRAGPDPARGAGPSG